MEQRAPGRRNTNHQPPWASTLLALPRLISRTTLHDGINIPIMRTGKLLLTVAKSMEFAKLVHGKGRI